MATWEFTNYAVMVTTCACTQLLHEPPASESPKSEAARVRRQTRSTFDQMRAHATELLFIGHRDAHLRH